MVPRVMRPVSVIKVVIIYVSITGKILNGANLVFNLAVMPVRGQK